MENKGFEPGEQGLVSIVLTLYNRKDYIIEQVESIFNQTYKNWELIIADDCSTDGSEEIIRNFIDEKGGRKKIIYIRNEKNVGVARNFQGGLERASGEYIAVCDSDDVWFPDKLEKELQFLRSGNYGMVYSDLVVVDASLKTIKKSFMGSRHSFFGNQKGDSFEELLNDNHIAGPTILFRAELASKLIPFSIYAIQDYWIVVISSIFSKIGCLNEPTVLYRQHSNNMVGAGAFTLTELISGKNKIVLEKHLGMKKNAILFLKDLLRVEGINEEVLEKINEKIKKQKALTEGLSLLQENKMPFWKFFLKLWKLGAGREILQLIYFKIF